jgi:YD repeat-containing protein
MDTSGQLEGVASVLTCEITVTRSDGSVEKIVTEQTYDAAGKLVAEREVPQNG